MEKGLFRVDHGRITVARLESQETIRYGSRLLPQSGNGNRSADLADAELGGGFTDCLNRPAGLRGDTGRGRWRARKNTGRRVSYWV